MIILIWYYWNKLYEYTLPDKSMSCFSSAGSSVTVVLALSYINDCKVWILLLVSDSPPLTSSEKRNH